MIAINSYDEYGIPGSANSGRFQYTGQMWLPEVGLYYYNARMYSPTLGGFMQTDPIGVEGGMNVYAYTGNDPVNAADPLGLASVIYGGKGYTICWMMALVSRSLTMKVLSLCPASGLAVRCFARAIPGVHSTMNHGCPPLLRKVCGKAAASRKISSRSAR